MAQTTRNSRSQRHWVCRSCRYFGKHGSNALVLRRWYRKFQAKNDHEKLKLRTSKLQAIHRARIEGRAQAHMNACIMRLQGWSAARESLRNRPCDVGSLFNTRAAE